MRAGVTIVDPADDVSRARLEIGATPSIYPEHDDRAARRAIGASVRIGPNARLSNARIGDRRRRCATASCVDATIGDDVRRSDRSRTCAAAARSATGVALGNFVEIKKSRPRRAA